MYLHLKSFYKILFLRNLQLTSFYIRNCIALFALRLIFSCEKRFEFFSGGPENNRFFSGGFFPASNPDVRSLNYGSIPFEQNLKF